MDVIPVGQMNIAMLIRLVQMMLHIIQDQNAEIQGLRRQTESLAMLVNQKRSELSQLRARIIPGLDAGTEAVEEGPETPDTLLHGLDVIYQLPQDGERAELTLKAATIPIEKPYGSYTERYVSKTTNLQM
ncbi:hypothetical protein FOXG_15453 [Fusarium oxysporum f. sp. lycopersici 4287]|uniref:Uncharacterized protein n=3 Tax=Fusarium oxysporum TaxID=5507 RepID=A0A0J9W3G2_FUSO4|nr:hypothetical protein FOXG_15453 [Fusarium oxysporum f. sp. lycopersici 4287]EXK43145.1 hypothetical protein FOMG_05805 [Fusarium oxysporum f. sp. melonis 26406]KNB17405.1 hypothetical protein FOXG_15453 [Fusarium oxysporum f. sp. lycopersici 4287]